MPPGFSRGEIQLQPGKVLGSKRCAFDITKQRQFPWSRAKSYDGRTCTANLEFSKIKTQEMRLSNFKILFFRIRRKNET